MLLSTAEHGSEFDSETIDRSYGMMQGASTIGILQDAGVLHQDAEAVLEPCCAAEASSLSFNRGSPLLGTPSALTMNCERAAKR